MTNSGLFRRCIFAVLLAASAAAFGCDSFPEMRETKFDETANGESATPAATPESEHLALGNPSNATPDVGNADNYLLIKNTAAMSYNDSRGTANWIAWKTTARSLGRSIPRPDFEPDPQLPKGFTRITTREYIGAGYQRGHMVPSADRFGDRTANAETFQMTNIVPQLGDLNEYPWEKLESYIRSLVRKQKDAFQIAGCYGEKTRLKRKVTVPTNCWKIALIVPSGVAAQDIDESTRVIAVDMPNTKGIAADDWRKYRTTVRTIEQRTGYDLLNALPAELQEKLESRIDR